MIIAFLITKGITAEIISSHEDVFVTPEHCLEEVWAHRDAWNRHGLEDAVLKEILADVERLFVHAIQRSIYRDKEPSASELIADPDDVPVMALAIHNEGIWTHDKHFSSKILRDSVKVLTTSDVLGMYPLKPKT